MSKGWSLLRQDIKVCFYCGRHEEFKDFFSQEFMKVLGREYNPDQWRLFIDSLKVSLKLEGGSTKPEK
jgi:hypothetical protein